MYIFHRVITCSINTVVELKSRFPQFSNAAFYQGITDSDQDDHHSKWDRWWGRVLVLLLCPVAVLRCAGVELFGLSIIKSVCTYVLVVGGLGAWCLHDVM